MGMRVVGPVTSVGMVDVVVVGIMMGLMLSAWLFHVPTILSVFLEELFVPLPVPMSIWATLLMLMLVFQLGRH